jgi:hypothetical protein
MSPPRRVTWCPSALCDTGFANPDRSVEDDRFAGVEPAQRGQVAQHRGGQFRADDEVEVLEGAVLFEAGAADSACQGGGVAAGDFVFAEHLQEFQVAEFPVAGLGQATGSAQVGQDLRRRSAGAVTDRCGVRATVAAAPGPDVGGRAAGGSLAGRRARSPAWNGAVQYECSVDLRSVLTR